MIRIRLDWHDWWIGMYWDSYRAMSTLGLIRHRIFICLIPCLPLVITWFTEEEDYGS